MKKVGIVLSSTLMLAGFVAAPVAVGFSARTATATGPAVTVQVKTLTKTLLGPVTVHGKTGWITKGGTPVGKCSGASAAGALDTATHSRWAGTYYPSLRDIFVTSILHVKPAGSDYWGIYVNGKLSSTGICAIKLHAGERLLFKIVK